MGCIVFVILLPTMPAFLSPEMVVLALNFVLVLIAYFGIYPKYCGADGNKIMRNDLLLSLISVACVALLYAGKGHKFNMLLFSSHWFWFAIISYTAIELPFMLLYFKKYHVWETFSQKVD